MYIFYFFTFNFLHAGALSGSFGEGHVQKSSLEFYKYVGKEVNQIFATV